MPDFSARMMGNYAVGETLGEGGFSKVKLGVDTRTSERVALKLLMKKGLRWDHNVLKQVKREIAAMSKVKHPNVITLKEVNVSAKYPKKDGTFHDVILVVLELATGGEFFDFLSYTGAFEEPLARTYFRQLVSGLMACHNQGVAHRDLKPENLLLDHRFNLKIADFGFAFVFDDPANPLGPGRMRTSCGTPGYMSPEQLQGHTYTKSSDVFSAGVVLFIMIAGFPPFEKAVHTDWWFHKLIIGKHHLFWKAHDRSAKFSTEVKDLLMGMLHPDPEQRLSLEMVIQHPWFLQASLGGDDFYAALIHRKQIVDKRRRMERLEKSRNAMEAVQIVYTPADHTVYRSISSQSPTLAAPALKKSLSPALDSEELPMRQPVSAAVETQEENEPEERAEVEKEEDAPVFVEDEHIAVYTSFYCACPPAVFIERLSNVVESVHGQISSRSRFKLRGSALSPSGKNKVSFTVHIFRAPAAVRESTENSDLKFVTFRRRGGDPLAFQKLFGNLYSQLADLIIVDVDV